MANTIRALFQVNDVLERRANGETTSQIVRLNPSYSPDPADTNHAFWQATPTGSLEMQINNPAVFGFFVPGKKYYLDFMPVEE